MDEAEQGVEFLCNKFEQLLSQLHLEQAERQHFQELYNSANEKIQQLQDESVKKATEFESELSSSTKEKLEVENVLDEKKRELEEIQRKCDGLENDIGRKDHLLSRRERELADARSQCEKLKEGIKGPKAENRKLMAFNSGMSREVQEYRMLVEQLQSDLTVSRESASNSRKKQVDAENSYKIVVQETNQLQDEKNRTLQELRQSIKSNAELRGTLQSERREKERLERSYAHYKERMLNIKMAKKTTDGLVQSLSKDLNGFQEQHRRIENLREEINRLQEQLSKEQQTKLDFMKQSEEHYSKLQKLQSEISNKDDRMTALKTEILQKDNLIKEWKCRCEEKETELYQVHKSLHQGEKPKVALNDLSTITREQSTMEQSTREQGLKLELNELKLEINDERQKTKEKDLKIERYGKKCKDLEGQIEKLKKSLEYENRNAELWKKETSKIASINRKLKDKNLDLQDQIKLKDADKGLRYKSHAIKQSHQIKQNAALNQLIQEDSTVGVNSHGVNLNSNVNSHYNNYSARSYKSYSHVTTPMSRRHASGSSNRRAKSIDPTDNRKNRRPVAGDYVTPTIEGNGKTGTAKNRAEKQWLPEHSSQMVHTSQLSSTHHPLETGNSLHVEDVKYSLDVLQESPVPSPIDIQYSPMDSESFPDVDEVEMNFYEKKTVSTNSRLNSHSHSNSNQSVSRSNSNQNGTSLSNSHVNIIPSGLNDRMNDVTLSASKVNSILKGTDPQMLQEVIRGWCNTDNNSHKDQVKDSPRYSQPVPSPLLQDVVEELVDSPMMKKITQKLQRKEQYSNASNIGSNNAQNPLVVGSNVQNPLVRKHPSNNPLSPVDHTPSPIGKLSGGRYGSSDYNNMILGRNTDAKERDMMSTRRLDKPAGQYLSAKPLHPSLENANPEKLAALLQSANARVSASMQKSNFVSPSNQAVGRKQSLCDCAGSASEKSVTPKNCSKREDEEASVPLDSPDFDKLIRITETLNMLEQFLPREEVENIKKSASTNNGGFDDPKSVNTILPCFGTVNTTLPGSIATMRNPASRSTKTRHR